MKQSLSAAGYDQPGDDHVWRRDGYCVNDSFDGDALYAELLEILRLTADISVFSATLPNACNDPCSRFHFSNERANLLRPFGACFNLQTRVLEIGAGCGAITRFLGESGAQVIALEASLPQARVARERTRDLPNVEVVADRLQDYKSALRFDVIVIVGALEYAPQYSFAEHPALEMLIAARALLHPEGKLLLATANQLGLKYLAGVPEDTLGSPMAGVEDRYPSRSSRTFGRLELLGLLNKAGFASNEFFVPLPDFKMPSTILSTKGALSPSEYFDASALATQAVRRDPRLTPTTFNLQLAWPEVFANGLALELCNSFLIQARPTAAGWQEPFPLAYHYSTQRVARFARETVFVESEGEGIRVRSHALCIGADKVEQAGVQLQVQADGPYYQGTLLITPIRDLLGTPGWSVDDLAARVREHVAMLSELLEAEGALAELKSFDTILPDHFLDATPGNLMLQPNGRAASFDLEWRVSQPTLGWVLWRSLLFLLGGTVLAPMEAVRAHSLNELINEVLSKVFDTPMAQEIWLEQELAFQLAVTGKDQRQAITGMLRVKIDIRSA